MPPSPYDPIGTVQQAITHLLLTHEPQFIGIGLRMYLSFAAIILSWYGVRMMLSTASGDHIFNFARLLLTISCGYAMVAYYESPIPGVGVSFSNLITDQTAFLASLLSARSVQSAQESLATLWSALERFLSRYVQTLPPGLRLEEQLLYGVHAVMILLTFTVGVLLVPSLTSSIFSGRSGESIAPTRLW